MRGRFRLATALICCFLAAMGFAAASFTQSSGEPGRERATATTTGRSVQPPSELWREFPLGEPTVATASADTVGAPAPGSPIESGDSEDGVALTLLLGLAALGLMGLGLATLVFLNRRQRRLVAESRQGLLAILAHEGPPEQRFARIQQFTAELECDKVSAQGSRLRGDPVTDESEVKTPGEESESAGRPRAYTELGDRVAAVLQAAEEAAAEIRGDAEVDADQMTSQAQQEAKSLLDAAKSEAQRVRVEADTEAKNTREAVESYATTHRREAEEKAAKLLTDAETQARASREAAEAMAQRIEESARTLEEEVREQERMIRGRLQRYLAALRDVSGQIEEVLGETGRAEPTLVEALDVERAKQESS